jgi:hypothetical protein
MESVLGLLLHENIARPIIVPVPIHGEKSVIQGLGGIGITRYLPSPSMPTMWECQEFPLDGLGSGEEERVLAVGWYSIRVTTSVDHKSESRFLRSFTYQGQANPTLERLLGQGTEYAGHRGPLLLLRVNEGENLLDISSIHVPRVLHGLARYDSFVSHARATLIKRRRFYFGKQARLLVELAGNAIEELCEADESNV